MLLLSLLPEIQIVVIISFTDHHCLPNFFGCNDNGGALLGSFINIQSLNKLLSIVILYLLICFSFWFFWSLVMICSQHVVFFFPFLSVLNLSEHTFNHNCFFSLYSVFSSPFLHIPQS